jgi:hypothetical protein
MVTVFCDPVAMNVYHTSVPGVPVSQVLVVLSLVAPTVVPVTHVLPDDGIDMTVADVQASLATCAFVLMVRRRPIKNITCFTLKKL